VEIANKAYEKPVETALNFLKNIEMKVGVVFSDRDLITRSNGDKT